MIGNLGDSLPSDSFRGFNININLQTYIRPLKSAFFRTANIDKEKQILIPYQHYLSLLLYVFIDLPLVLAT